jgi:glutathione S-transferase
MAIELYVFPPSPRAFKVMVVANHLGIDAAFRFLDLRKGEQKEAGYARLNPNQRMPTLRDGDDVVWESEAILQYLALKNPAGGLLPADARARLAVTQWQFWNLAHWDPACAVFAFEYVAKRFLRGGAAAPGMAAIAKATEVFHRAASVLEGQLDGKRFVLGDTLTLADFSLGAAMTLAEAAHLPLAPYGAIARWHATLAALPAWQQTLAQVQAMMAKAA